MKVGLQATLLAGCILAVVVLGWRLDSETTTKVESRAFPNDGIQLVSYQQCGTCGQSDCQGCQSANRQSACSTVGCGQFGYPCASCRVNRPGRPRLARNAAPQHNVCDEFDSQAPGPIKFFKGVDGSSRYRRNREAGWKDSKMVPWEMFAYGEYIGPHRTPHVPDYRIRVNDQLEFNYLLTREKTMKAYEFQVGDIISISSAIDTTLDQVRLEIISDGMVSLKLIGQVQAAGKTVEGLQAVLNERYKRYVKNPSIVVQGVQTNTRLQDLRDAVDARAGVGGQSQLVTVSPDGTLQLPLVGSVPAIGLSLDEIRREVNARYREMIRGIGVTPKLVQRASRFIYVVGQVQSPGRIEMVGPTTVMQAIAMAQGDLAGGNLRNVIVFRRDAQWRLVATRLDLAGALYGNRPRPSDEIWLRDSDIVLIPKKPITRLSEAVDLYLTQTLYSIFPQEIVFDFDNVGALGN